MLVIGCTAMTIWITGNSAIGDQGVCVQFLHDGFAPGTLDYQFFEIVLDKLARTRHAVDMRTGL